MNLDFIGFTCDRSLATCFLTNPYLTERGRGISDMSRQKSNWRSGTFLLLVQYKCTKKIEFFQQQIKRDNSLQEFGFELTSSEAVPHPFSVATSDFLAKQ